jgi:D-aminopeptidase
VQVRPAREVNFVIVESKEPPTAIVPCRRSPPRISPLTGLSACLSICVLAGLCSAQAVAQTHRPAARDLGVSPGIYQPGPNNSITDVAGVKVGQVTVVKGKDIRTGVTAILPHAGNIFKEKVSAAVGTFNAFGKLIGSTQVSELGQMETPIVLTNTLSVWDAARALTDWTLAQPGNESVTSVNPVVGETNDSSLNDIRRHEISADSVLQALNNASDGPVEQGSVGAGTGTVCFGWKGGIGSSSRRLPEAAGGYTVGVLVQSNFGGKLTIAGKQIWKQLSPENLPAETKADGSCMIVIATDAPLDARQLKRLAARSFFGMARTGSTASNGSGDYAIAFSTSRRLAGLPESCRTVADENLSPLFEAVIDCTEEAIYNSLLKATTVSGYAGHRAQAIPIDKLKDLLSAGR